MAPPRRNDICDEIEWYGTLQFGSIDDRAAGEMVDQTDERLQQLAQSGDPGAWGQLLEAQQERLLRTIRLRLDPRLRNRLDPIDVIQETFLEATQRRNEFFEKSTLPFFVWLRLLALQKLNELNRRHIGAQARSVKREVSRHVTNTAETSALIVSQLLGHITTPSRLVAQEELEQRLRSALDQLDPIDREVIVLRNFERLSNLETAEILKLPASTTSSRYIRALKKLRQILRALEDFSGVQISRTEL